MKIGIDISQVVYQGTGVSQYVRKLVWALLLQEQNLQLFGSALNRSNQLLDFIHTLPTTGSYSSKMIHLPPTVLSLLWNSLHVYPIEKIIGSVDVFHSSDWVEPPSCIPKVTTIHDLVVYTHPQYSHPKIVATQKAKLAWVKKESAAIIADSQNTKKDIINYLGIDEKKIQVLYLGVDSQFFHRSVSDIERVKKKYQISGNYVLSLGTQEPRKNLARVVSAFASLRTTDVSLVIGGNYGWGSEVKPISGVQMIGYVDDADLPALYSGAVCFCYPSLYEGFGLPVLEAMASGTPVITSQAGSLGEISKNTALHVDPEQIDDIASALKKLIGLGKKERSALITKGIAHAGEFSWEKTATATIDVYKSVASG